MPGTVNVLVSLALLGAVAACRNIPAEERYCDAMLGVLEDPTSFGRLVQSGPMDPPDAVEDDWDLMKQADADLEEMLVAAGTSSREFQAAMANEIPPSGMTAAEFAALQVELRRAMTDNGSLDAMQRILDNAREEC